MFRASSAHLQEDIVVYRQHMVPSLSIRVLVACRYAARVSGRLNNKVFVRILSVSGPNFDSWIDFFLCYCSLNSGLMKYQRKQFSALANRVLIHPELSHWT